MHRRLPTAVVLVAFSMTGCAVPRVDLPSMPWEQTQGGAEMPWQTGTRSSADDAELPWETGDADGGGAQAGASADASKKTRPGDDTDGQPHAGGTSGGEPAPGTDASPRPATARAPAERLAVVQARLAVLERVERDIREGVDARLAVRSRLQEMRARRDRLQQKVGQDRQAALRSDADPDGSARKGAGHDAAASGSPARADIRSDDARQNSGTGSFQRVADDGGAGTGPTAPQTGDLASGEGWLVSFIADSPERARALVELLHAYDYDDTTRLGESAVVVVSGFDQKANAKRYAAEIWSRTGHQPRVRLARAVAEAAGSAADDADGEGTGARAGDAHASAATGDGKARRLLTGLDTRPGEAGDERATAAVYDVLYRLDSREAAVALDSVLKHTGVTERFLSRGRDAIYVGRFDTLERAVERQRQLNRRTGRMPSIESSRVTEHST